MLNRSPQLDTSVWTRLSDEGKLAFGAAGGCLLVGAFGGIVNAIADGAVALDGLLAVGGFYFLLGLANARQSKPRKERTNASLPAETQKPNLKLLMHSPSLRVSRTSRPRARGLEREKSLPQLWPRMETDG